jgi:hypothetical protein
MICPVCEHQQEFGFECEVCGKDLGGIDMLGPPPVAPQTVEGLEQTLMGPVGDVPLETLGDLSVTRYDAAPDGPIERLADVEATGQAAVGVVPLEAVPDFQTDRVADDGVRTLLLDGPQPCRYCRHVQAEGAVCDRCGMRLPRGADAVPLVVGTGAEPVKRRCPTCGAPGLAGERCSECGREVPFPEA